ncbi:MAG: flagellar motor switch phosphatase FliY [Bacillota bacterium]|jgi:flagellar motor switch protein FliN/FliY|nr:flagellar motor switch phosphatase FliY [Bacillota bacterium]
MAEDMLSQEELDALLAQHRGATQEAEKDTPDQESSDDYSAFDVTEFLTAEEQDTLAEIGNISMGSAATALSTLVNRKVSITVPSVHITTPRKLSESYPIPCIVVNVNYSDGLKGENFLVIRERDALVIGNLMMGEDGTNLPEELSEIYLSAVTEAMNMMMGSASTAMSELFGRFIEITPPSTSRKDLSEDPLVEDIPDEKPVVAITFRMEIQDLVDSSILQVVDVDFAKAMVSSLMPGEEEEMELEPEVSAASWSVLKEQPSVGAQPETVVTVEELPRDLGNINIDLIRDIPVQVRAVLGRTKMSIENILRLGPGHIMELDSLHGEPIELYANDTLVARGEVVVVGEQFGVRITEIATQRDRIGSIR